MINKNIASVLILGEGLDPDQYWEQFLELGPEDVVLTLGKRGSLIGLSSGERYRLYPKPIDSVDVTGAGDAFWSGLLAGLLEDLPVADAAKLGQAVAETKISQLGPIREYIPHSDYHRMADDIKITLTV